MLLHYVYKFKECNNRSLLGPPLQLTRLSFWYEWKAIQFGTSGTIAMSMRSFCLYSGTCFVCVHHDFLLKSLCLFCTRMKLLLVKWDMIAFGLHPHLLVLITNFSLFSWIFETFWCYYQLQLLLQSKLEFIMHFLLTF